MSDKKDEKQPEPIKLNGIAAHRVGSTIFIPLPRSLWRSCDGCCCRYCSDTRQVSSEVAYWDTLAVSMHKPADGRDYTWTVHAPEYHGAKPKREKD